MDETREDATVLPSDGQLRQLRYAYALAVELRDVLSGFLDEDWQSEIEIQNAGVPRATEDWLHLLIEVGQMRLATLAERERSLENALHACESRADEEIDIQRHLWAVRDEEGELEAKINRLESALDVLQATPGGTVREALRHYQAELRKLDGYLFWLGKVGDIPLHSLLRSVKRR